jgi:hypothetical protein
VVAPDDIETTRAEFAAVVDERSRRLELQVAADADDDDDDDDVDEEEDDVDDDDGGDTGSCQSISERDVRAAKRARIDE